MKEGAVIKEEKLTQEEIMNLRRVFSIFISKVSESTDDRSAVVSALNLEAKIINLSKSE